MKKMLLILLLVPVLGFAQRDEWTKAWLLNQPDSLGKPITMPKYKYYSKLYSVFEIGQKSTYVYTITADSVYHKIFNDLPKDSLPAIDFSKQELMVYVACPQCLATCHHTGRDNEPCHRNACMYKESWYVKDKKLLSRD